MKTTDRRILKFVESIGGITRLASALKIGAKRQAKLQEDLTVALAERDVARTAHGEVSEKLSDTETRLTEARSRIDSSVRMRRSGAMFENRTPAAQAPTAKAPPSRLRRLMR